jgi:N-acylglucosamine-6-phosphate 2-epimerase
MPMLDAHLGGGLVVSCQPVEAGPLDHDESVLRMACAAVAGGARALRVEGAQRVALVRPAVQVPIIGIVKRDLPGLAVRITPLLEDVHALVQAGADVIAVDATGRSRPCSLQSLLEAIHGGGRVAMADASCRADALQAWEFGFDIIGTTLSGYTDGLQVPSEPDLDLVRRLHDAGCRVMAEGRYDTPERAAQAMRAGAWAVTVGTALTRLEVMTSWFAAGVATGRMG